MDPELGRVFEGGRDLAFGIGMLVRGATVVGTPHLPKKWDEDVNEWVEERSQDPGCDSIAAQYISQRPREEGDWERGYVTLRGITRSA